MNWYACLRYKGVQLDQHLFLAHLKSAGEIIALWPNKKSEVNLYLKMNTMLGIILAKQGKRKALVALLAISVGILTGGMLLQLL